MITLQNIEKQFGTKILYNKASVSINPGNRIGCIGPNGTGKTVLLRILSGEETVDKGEVVIPSDIKLGYLPQEMDLDLSMTPLELVQEPFQHFFEIESTLEKLSGFGDTNSVAYKKAAEEYDTLQTELAIHDVYSLNSRAKAILTGLGVPESTWDQSMTILSGGFRMRVVLAKLLLIEPDFLLLDEPTNHLDMDSLIWLDKFLQKFKGGMCIVSHDRDFLSRLTNNTIEIVGGEIIQYAGNVDSYVAWKEEHSVTEARRVKNIQDKIAQAERFITRFKAKNTKASQARSKMKQLEKLKEQLPQQKQTVKTIRFQFPEPVRSGQVPIKLDTICVAFDSVKVFENLSLTVTRGDKIAILGPNGAGKSTLLKTCFGSVKPQSGSVTVGHNTDMRFYNQHRLEQLDKRKTCFNTVADVAKSSNRTFIQSILGAFLFSGDEIDKKVGVLSGGEKSRLSLATLLADPGNVLLLDEPTNHLDIASVERLAYALENFKGTLLFVSHDDYFISHIANRIIELRPGLFRDFPGSLPEYRSYIESCFIDPLQQDTVKPQENKLQNNTKKDERISKRRKRKQIERTIGKIEKKIHSIEKEIAQLESELNSPQNAQNYDLLTEIHNKLDEQKGNYKELMYKWEHYQIELEAITQE